MHDPYIHLIKSNKENAAFFVVLLNSIAHAPDGSKDFAQSILNKQSDFIATLVGVGVGAGIELRFVSSPNIAIPQDGRIDIAIRVRAQGKTAQEAAHMAIALYQSFMPSLLSMSDLYTWRVVSTAKEYKMVVPEHGRWHMKEMLRRERYLLLEKLPEHGPISHIGFIPDDHVAQSAEAGKVHVCFPFLRNYATLRGLFTELLHQRNRVIVCVTLRPTKATEEERQFVYEQLLSCERYMQLPIHGSVKDPSSFYPPLRQQSSILAEQIQQELSVLRDEVFLGTVHILSEIPVPQMLCESIGVTITEHLQTADPESDVRYASGNAPFNGGYDWVEPTTSAKQRQAIGKIRRLEYAGITQGLLHKKLRIRRLFGVNQASCAFRLPVPLNEDFPGVQTSRVKQLPPPTECQDGLYLGLNNFGSSLQRVCMQPEDRLRHTYVVGKTGTGKSTFLKNNIMQDILSGKGVGVFDPHGELVDEIINYIPIKRMKDVVLIKPELEQRSIGLNLLDVETDLEKDSVINYLIEVFQTIFNMDVAGGPIFEMYFRNAALLLMEKGGQPNTIMDIHRIFEDERFRNSKIDACRDPMVTGFWKGQALRARGETGLSNMGPYITSKLVRLTHTSSMRRILSQPKSTIDFENILENNKILLVDLSKGELGSLSSSFLGMTLIKLIQTVAFRRRKNGMGKSPKPFYLYFDEFQNLATPSFLDLLSESRKYGLAMTLANQYIHQIPEAIRDALIGNVGAVVSFRVGLTDAKVLEDSFAPSVAAKDFINLPNFSAYVSMLKNGDVCRPFNIETEPVVYPATPDASARVLRYMGRYTKLVS